MLHIAFKRIYSDCVFPRGKVLIYLVTLSCKKRFLKSSSLELQHFLQCDVGKGNLFAVSMEKLMCKCNRYPKRL